MLPGAHARPRHPNHCCGMARRRRTKAVTSLPNTVQGAGEACLPLWIGTTIAIATHGMPKVDCASEATSLCMHACVRHSCRYCPSVCSNALKCQKAVDGNTPLQQKTAEQCRQCHQAACKKACRQHQRHAKRPATCQLAGAARRRAAAPGHTHSPRVPVGRYLARQGHEPTHTRTHGCIQRSSVVR